MSGGKNEIALQDVQGIIAALQSQTEGSNSLPLKRI